MATDILSFEGLTYYKKGTSPRFLFMSGIHGDEYGVIEHVETYIQSHNDTLPDFLYIPISSPSAVARKTRVNGQGNDINRQFTHDTTDTEVVRLMNLLSTYSFTHCIQFHEDKDRTNEFYLYDTEKFLDSELKRLQNAITTTGASLYTGTDDEQDADLGLYVENGYIYHPLANHPPQAGFSWAWLLQHNVVSRALDIEIPGKASSDLKKALVSAFFTFLSQTFFVSYEKN